MEIQPKINEIITSRKEWLREVPNIIRNLIYNYNFYFVDGLYCRIHRDIKDLISEKYVKNRHKIILYRDENKFYLVVYAKKNITIYICSEYNNCSWSSIKYFLNKFKKYKQEALKDK